MTSPALEKMLANRRTEEEARRDAKMCHLCKGSGRIRGRSLLTEAPPLVPCPACSKESSDARS